MILPLIIFNIFGDVIVINCDTASEIIAIGRTTCTKRT